MQPISSILDLNETLTTTPELVNKLKLEASLMILNEPSVLLCRQNNGLYWPLHAHHVSRVEFCTASWRTVLRLPGINNTLLLSRVQQLNALE